MNKYILNVSKNLLGLCHKKVHKGYIRKKVSRKLILAALIKYTFLGGGGGRRANK